MRHATILVAILAFVPLTSVMAQEPPPVKPGDRVRVTAPDLGIRKQAATFEAWRGDTLVIVADSSMTFPLASVTRLDVHRGQKGHWVRGLAIGSAVGAIVGTAVFLDEKFGSCPLSPPDLPCTRNVETVLAGAAFAAGAGALLGALVGLAIRTDSWEEVPLEQLRVSIAPQRDGRLGLGASVRF